MIDKTMKTIIAILFMCALCAGWANAAERTLTFLYEQEMCDDLAGWTLYYGTDSGNYTNSIDIPYDGNPLPEYQSEQKIIAADGAETTLYFAMDAYDTSDNHSAYSEEVSATLDFLSPNTPVKFTVTVQGQP